MGRTASADTPTVSAMSLHVGHAKERHYTQLVRQQQCSKAHDITPTGHGITNTARTQT